jgi:Domain of unknown function (DU1801)
MASVTTVNQYLASLDPEKRAVLQVLRKAIKSNLPIGFDETITSGMIGYVVPLKTYPAGYHATPNTPLALVSIAAQKNFFAMYHMGLYGSKPLLQWWTKAYATADVGKLDMGKSCVRWKSAAKIPFTLVGKLATKLTPTQWVAIYESARNSRD